MMKNLLLAFSIFLLASISVNSQCTPDGTYTSPGIYPDTLINLPFAYVNYPYTAVITAVIPADTSGLPIDSIGIVGWTGNPAGFIYTANTPSGFWPGGGNGCILISGTPSPADVGTYHLVFNVNAMLSLGTLPYTVNGYKIIVKDSVLGISDKLVNSFDLLQNSPNPFSANTEIEFSSAVEDFFDFSVINIIGEEVFHQRINAHAGKNSFTFCNPQLPSGIYIYKLSNKSFSQTRRMNIE